MVNRPKKVIPFDHDYIPRFEHEIKLREIVYKILYRGDLLIYPENPLIGVYFFNGIPTDKGRVMFSDVYFDPMDNSMAVYIKGQFTIIDYEKCKPKEK